MVDSIVLNVNAGNNSTRKFTLNVENKKLVNCIVPVDKNKTITAQSESKLMAAASRAGDKGILESCDLTPSEKIQMMYQSDYGAYYDIKLSRDGKYYEVTIKKTNCITPDPSARTIKSDFGVGKGVLLEHNNDLFKDRFSGNPFMDDSRNNDYDNTKFRPGDVIRIPVEDVNVNPGDTARGFWRRAFKN